MSTESNPRKKLFLTHNACLNASYDFKLLKEGFRRRGYLLVDRPEDADEVIFSGCAVREIWVDDVINQINTIYSRAPQVKFLITGCVASVSSERIARLAKSKNVKFGRQEEILKTYTGFELAVLDRETIQDASHDYEGAADNGLTQLRLRVGRDKAEVVALLQQVDREQNTQLESLYRRTTKGFVFYHETEPVEFVTVTRSCPYQCSFCTIPLGRGAFTTVPLDAILEKARRSLSRGIRRITLIGDEVGNYGMGSSGPRFRDLVTSLMALDPELRLSIRYIEPKPFLKNATLIEQLCRSGRIELLYISLQSGSQRVLKAMNRGYNINEITHLYSSLRRTTDTVFYSNWMVGFPGETNEEYMETVDLVRRLNLQINVIIPFSRRPNTPANEMVEHISEPEKEQRVENLTQVVSEMKVTFFEQRLINLDASRRKGLLEKIRRAELSKYEDDAKRPEGADEDLGEW